MLQKIRKIWKSKWLILEGVFNYYFTRKKIERIASYRSDICTTCPLIDLVGTKCEIPGTQPCCGDCGCSLKYKTRSMSSECPQGRWFAVMTEEEEDEINSKLDIDEVIETEPDPGVNANSLFKKQDVNYAKLQDEDYVNDFLLTQELLEIPNACEDACILEPLIDSQKERRGEPSYRFAQRMLGAAYIFNRLLNNNTYIQVDYHYLVGCYIEYPTKFREWCEKHDVNIDMFLIPVQAYYMNKEDSVEYLTIKEIYDRFASTYNSEYSKNKGDDMDSDIVFACVEYRGDLKSISWS